MSQLGAKVKGTLLGVPVSTMEPAPRKLNDGLGAPRKVSRQRDRVRRRSAHWASGLGSLAQVWCHSGGGSSWGAFSPADDEKDAISKQEIRWMRLLFAAAALGRDGLEAAYRVLDVLDEPMPEVASMTPFAATEDDEQFALLAALLCLTGGLRLQPDSVQEKRFQDFKAAKLFIEDAQKGVPNAERVYRQIRAMEPREMLIREIFSCRTVEEGGTETLMDWYRQGRFDEIERAIPSVVGRVNSQRPW